MKAILQEIDDKLWSAITERDDPTVASAFESQQTRDHISLHSDATGYHVLSNDWKRTLYLDRELVKLRYKNLVSLAASYPSLSSAIGPQISLQMIKKILELPQRLHDGSQVSRRILRICALAFMKFLDSSPEEQHESRDTAPDSIEQCEICDDPIEFENLTWARCSQGHQFSEQFSYRLLDDHVLTLA